MNIRANKYHEDHGYQIDPDYTNRSIKLSAKGRVVFVPKSITTIHQAAGGDYFLEIEDWYCSKPENKQFFKLL